MMCEQSFEMSILQANGVRREGARQRGQRVLFTMVRVAALQHLDSLSQYLLSKQTFPKDTTSPSGTVLGVKRAQH